MLHHFRNLMERAQRKFKRILSGKSSKDHEIIRLENQRAYCHGLMLGEQEKKRLESLDKKIQALPQELQDLILDFKIAVNPNDEGVILVTEDYKPPVGLQLNRKIRASFAAKYYSGAIFQLAYLPFGSASDKMFWNPYVNGCQCRPWAFESLSHFYNTLDSSHSTLIRNIRLEKSDLFKCRCFSSLRDRRGAARLWVHEFTRRTPRCECPVRDGVVAVQLHMEFPHILKKEDEWYCPPPL